jgi:hypothetical protein
MLTIEDYYGHLFPVHAFETQLMVRIGSVAANIQLRNMGVGGGGGSHT